MGNHLNMTQLTGAESNFWESALLFGIIFLIEKWTEYECVLWVDRKHLTKCYSSKAPSPFNKNLVHLTKCFDLLLH